MTETESSQDTTNNMSTTSTQVATTESSQKLPQAKRDGQSPKSNNCGDNAANKTYDDIENNANENTELLQNHEEKLGHNKVDEFLISNEINNKDQKAVLQGDVLTELDKMNEMAKPRMDSVVSSAEVPPLNTAISLRHACKHYGRGARKVPVLVNLNMTIPKGAIYGLLGPSGCGKTTLLSTIVGKQRLHGGEVMVFGGPPGSAVSGVPGQRVGYMPQELALYGEFTIAETLRYFGRIFDLSKEKIEERTKFLMQFLDLPQGKRLIMNLSGGQQRRASLATALLHEPELLILDEPTVGVDPLLRTSIWRHLLDISKSGKMRTTIVITTHYIEEARQANVVGMMRFGRLLAEGSPENLLEIYQQPNLEDVFLQLCVGDEVGREDGDEDTQEILVKEEEKAVKAYNASIANSPSKKSENNRTIDSGGDASYVNGVDTVAFSQNNNNSGSNSSSNFCSSFIRLNRLTALTVKNFIRMWRNIGFLIFQFIIPTVQVSLFCLAIGREPTGMSMAVFNEDISTVDCQGYTTGCLLGSKDSFFGTFDGSMDHRKNLSCRYLSYIDPEFVKPVFYPDLDQAIDAAKKAKHWGVLHFKPNYTEALYSRLFGLVEEGKIPDNETMDQGEVHTYLDMTNQQVGFTIQLGLSEAYQQYAQGLLSSCGQPEDLASLPISFEEPIYGSNDPTFTEFMAPGVILSITYFMAVGLTALSFIIERKEGLLDRSWVAGVTATEVMLAHVVSQFVVMVVQVGLVLVFMIYVFQVPAVGSMLWIILLTILQGICGMSFGLVISALCDNEQDAIQLALGSFYPNLLLSGIIWPLEGMPEELRYISYVLPQTYACEAMRGVLSRGWGIEWMPVWRGYLVTIAWIILLLILSAVCLKIRR